MNTVITTTFRPTHEAISLRAREIWMHLGSPAGQDLTIWLQAEEELSGVACDPHRSIDLDQLQECLDYFGYLNRPRGPTSLT